jgi:hypothetical protein
MPSEDQKVLMKFDFYKNEFERYLNGIVGGVWGSVKLKRNGACAECPKMFKKSKDISRNNNSNLNARDIKRPSSTKKCSFIK